MLEVHVAPRIGAFGFVLQNALLDDIAFSCSFVALLRGRNGKIRILRNHEIARLNFALASLLEDLKRNAFFPPKCYRYWWQ